MRIEKTFRKEGVYMNYILTDNICMCCKHNPDNYNPLMGYDGKCKNIHHSVVECEDYKKIASV